MSEHQFDRSPKRRKIADTSITDDPSSVTSTGDQIKWRSPAEQRTYSSKLVEALRLVKRNRNNKSSSSWEDSASQPASASASACAIASASASACAVREIADKVLAIAARGRTRWSRAILKKRLKLRLRSHKKAKSKLAAPTTGCGRSRSAVFPLPPMQRRVRLLSRSRSAVLPLSPMQRRVRLLSRSRSALLPLPPMQRRVRLLSRSRSALLPLPTMQRRVRLLSRLVPGCRKLSFRTLLDEATDYISALEMQVRAMTELANLLTSAQAAE